MSSPEAVKVKRSKHKTVKKLKCKETKAKCEYDSSEDESRMNQVILQKREEK